jgi:hypothetical protein
MDIVRAFPVMEDLNDAAVGVVQEESLGLLLTYLTDCIDKIGDG